MRLCSLLQLYLACNYNSYRHISKYKTKQFISKQYLKIPIAQAQSDYLLILAKSESTSSASVLVLRFLAQANNTRVLVQHNSICDSRNSQTSLDISACLRRQVAPP